MKVVLVGCGYWGKILLKKILERRFLELVAIVDPAEETVTTLAHDLPTSTAMCRSIDEVPPVDFAIVAVPPSFHLSVIEGLITKVKAIWLEKPCGANIQQCSSIIELCKRSKVQLFVDLPFIYDKGYEYIKKLYVTEEYGRLTHVSGARLNLGGAQMGADLVMDLAIHDYSILADLADSVITSKGKIQFFHASAGRGRDLSTLANVVGELVPESSAKITFSWNLGWVSSSKIRWTEFYFEGAIIRWDPFTRHSPITVNESYIDVNSLVNDRTRAQYRIGVEKRPAIDDVEPLSVVFKNFLEFKNDSEIGLIHKNALICQGFHSFYDTSDREYFG